MKILLVEDDPTTSEFLRVSLTACRYTVDIVNDGQTALEVVDQFSYDLIILDVMIPRVDGISVCRQLRNKGYKTPILFLTARNLNEEMIAGLDAGADDYLSKPFDLAQLLARIRALLRRTETVTSPVLTWSELCLDPNVAQVTYKHQEVRLSPQEYRLLELFLRNPLRAFSRNDIIDHLWTIDDLPTEAAVTNLIKDLRKRLKKAGLDQEIIQTVYGLGYRLKSAPQEDFAEKQGGAIKAAQIEESGPRGFEAIAQVSKWFRSSLEQRLEQLKAVEQALKNHTVTPEQREQAREQAHKLIGGLGTFGYRVGSDIAREMEQLLQASATFDSEQVARLSELLTNLKQEIEEPPTFASVTDSQPLLPLIWVIGGSELFSNAIQQIATVRELRVKELTHLAPADQPIQQSEYPSIILFYNSVESNQDDQLQLLQELKKQFPKVPILTVAEQDSLESRRMFARAGSDRYILASAPMEEVFETIAQILPQCSVFDAKAIAVDDDPIVLQKLTELLQPWGIQVTALSSPEGFWQVLTATEPDILLLDLEMPTIQGIELCRVVRQDSKYGDLPILVVTAHTESKAVQQVFDAGADDFIAKPFVGPELVTRVVNRVERSRMRKQLLRFQRENFHLWERTSRSNRLVQLSSRHYFVNFLTEQWQQLAFEQTPLSLILCDVDYFRAYEDEQGYRAGDACLQQIVHEIQNCIGSNENLVAHYDEFIFVIVLPNINLDRALQIAEHIRQAIAVQKIAHPASPISTYITVSMGISGTTPTNNKSPKELVEVAEQALHAAKVRGRNTYCLYPF